MPVTDLLCFSPVLMVAGYSGLGPAMLRLILQMAAILLAAGLGGFVVRRFFRGPPVMGEMLAGMLIGPHALGGMRLGTWGPFFPASGGGFPVSFELYGFAVFASLLLLFLAGLETDLRAFLRYSFSGGLIGLGGFVGSFLLGAWSLVLLGAADSLWSPRALFMGTIATATSIGLTARLLSERRQMSSPEGVTILAGAVFDDVLGIVLLAVVAAMTTGAAEGKGFEPLALAGLAGKALGFWIGCMTVGLLLAPSLSRALKRLRSPQTMAALSLGLALLLAGLAEWSGLAMIIGAYIMGLALSRTDLNYELQGRLHGLYTFLVPVFFCVMGMLVDWSALRGVVGLGLAYTLACLLGKLLGCGLPAWATIFNLRGALRVGAGMLPRSEVALIIAGVGLASGAMGQDLFGVVIMMVLLTTLATPPLLLKAFRGASGLREKAGKPQTDTETVRLHFPSPGLAEFLVRRIAHAFRNEEFFVHRLPIEQPTYQIRKEDMAFTLRQDGPEVSLTLSVRHRFVGRMIVLEELLSIQDLLDAVKRMQSPGSMGGDLVAPLFDGPAPDAGKEGKETGRADAPQKDSRHADS